MNRTILDFLPGDAMKKAAGTRGGEWHGPCPSCGGENRFRVQPKYRDTGFFKCRRCGVSGDGIQLLRDFFGMPFKDACEAFGVDRPGLSEAAKVYDGGNVPKRKPEPDLPRPTHPPPAKWQGRALELAAACESLLWTEAGERARAYLHHRGLSDAIIRAVSLGYNPADVYEPPEAWGMERENQVWIPRGITIPWVLREGNAHAVWRLNVRRSSADLGPDDAKYIGPAGCSNGLYMADRITYGLPCVLVEGEIDALSILQSAHDVVTAAATGSTSWSRRERWITRLSLASVVLVAFDAEEAGEDAAAWWLDELPNAVRLRPEGGKDANDMLRSGGEAAVRAWIERALECAAVAA